MVIEAQFGGKPDITRGSSRGKTAVSDTVNGGSIPSPRTSEYWSVVQRLGRKILILAMGVRFSPLQPCLRGSLAGTPACHADLGEFDSRLRRHVPVI
jgi:hypothetical protein